MKKFFILCICLGLILSGCGKKDNIDNENNSESSEPIINDKISYKNGSYKAEMDSYIDGWKEFVKIDIANNVVTISEFDAINQNGDLVSQVGDNESYSENNKSLLLPSYTHSEKNSLIIEKFIDSDKDLLKMECVSGATKSSNHFKLLVNKIIKDNAITGNIETAVVHRLGDGEYRVEEHNFSSGWKDYVTITVKDGMPTVTEFNSYDDEKNLKSDDTEYNEKMLKYSKSMNKGSICPTVYISELTKLFNENYNLETGEYEFENIAGATISSNIFKELAQKALHNSYVRGKSIDTLYKYKDGIYSAEMQDFEDGWKDYVKLEIKNDNIKILEFNSIDLIGNLKTEDNDIKMAMINGNSLNNLPEIYPEKYISEIISHLYQSNSNILEMENVSGATLSSNNFKLMVGEILRTNAFNGKTEIIKVKNFNNK